MGLYKQKYNALGKLGFSLVPSSTIVTFKEAVANSSLLPLSGNTVYDGRITSDDGHLWIWDGTQWLDQGDIIDTEWASISGKPSSSVADIDDAVSKKHTQGTDQGLDIGGPNAVTAAQSKTAYTHSGVTTGNPHQVTKTDVGLGNVPNLDTTDAINKAHEQNTDIKLDEGGENEISAQQLRELLLVGASADNIIGEIESKLQLPYTVLHTNTDPSSLNTIIQTLNDGDILEVDSSVVYNPISIPANKELIIRPSLGKYINLTGTECIKLMNGARDTIIAGVSIQNCSSPANNERGAGISFGEQNAIVSNISFYNISIDTVTNGSGVMLSYHWSVGGDTYYTPNTIEECSNDVRFINCDFYKANKDNTEGAALSLRGIIKPFIYNNSFRDNALSMRQIQLQNCINSYIAYNNIRNTATPGTNSEGIKLDDLGSCTFRTTGYIISNTIKNAVEGIDIDDNVTAYLFDNICYECTEEGISVDDSAIAVLVRNLCYNCRYDINSSGIRVENGALVSLNQNNCVNNMINYRIQNGYVLPVGNTQSITDIILKDSAENLIYSGDILNVYNIKGALDNLQSNKSNINHIHTESDITNLVEDIKNVSLNIMLNAFRIAQIGSLTIFQMVKGFMDEYEDESGIDTINSTNEIYDAVNDYYKNWDDTVDAETKLLLHLDNNVTDYELTPKTVTNNNVTFSTTNKFGTHSASFNGSTSVLSVPDSEDFNFGSGDFTMEAWVNIPSNTGSGQRVIIGHLTDASNWMGISYIDQAGYYVFYAIMAIQGVYTVELIGTITPTLNTWNHVAFIRNGNTWTLYVNGVADGSTTESNVAGNFTGDFCVGARTAGGSLPFNGLIDEIRISKGIARWTSNFTPPSSPYPISLVDNMTLLSNAQVAESAPTEARIVMFEEDVDSITLNTDLKAYVSRDDGTTFSQVTLEDEGNYITGARILSGVVDISAQPSGTNIKYKVETLNDKKLNIHGTAVSWK